MRLVNSFLCIPQYFLFICFLTLSCSCQESDPKILYINSNIGDDNNPGTIDQPFKTLEKVSSLDLKPGDQLLISNDSEIAGSLILKDIRGTENNPIIISSYGEPNTVSDYKPIINFDGFLYGILLENCSYIEINNLKIKGEKSAGKSNLLESEMRCGVLATTTRPGIYEHIFLHNLEITNVFFENPGFVRPDGEVRSANGTQKYGWGIRFINNLDSAVIRNIEISRCKVENVSHTGIKFTSRNSLANYGISDFKISDNRVSYSGGPGIQMSGVSEGYISGNQVDQSGSNDDSRKWGRGSGLWTWGSSNVLIEKNHFTNANGPGDSAGAHIDYNCRIVVLQYNLSANNAGGFCEILGNNFNCAYRYNISVNDGYRVKGVEGAFQEGKVFWLSGHRGNKKRYGPINSYFYNNTIYVSEKIVTKVAIDNAASGILIANNIFYIKGESKAVLGDQYNPDKGGESEIENVVFRNNLYLRKENWPEGVPIRDAHPVIGDPEFMNMGGQSITDYIPTNRQLIKDGGIIIQNIPNDTVGLTLRLNVDHDILGNMITGTPDFGAIEMN